MTEARILIVEDRSLTAKHLQLCLSHLGYATCGVAASGDEAVEKARETNPDLILMDVMLAGETDGTEAARSIKSFLDVPIVFLTAYSDAAIVKRATSIDPSGYLLKPFREEELQIVIEMSLYKHRMEKLLRESEAKFGILFDKSRDAILILEGEGTGMGKIVSANPAAEEMHGYLPGELPNLHISDLDAPEEAEKLPERMGKMAAGEWIKAVITRRKRDGAVFFVESHAGMVEFSGHRYILAFDRDVTEELRARDLLLRSERLKAVGDLATGMAHHFTNMLQVVMGGASVALMKMESGELADTQSWLNKILLSAQWGAQTVRHLLEFVRLGTEQSGTPEVFDLSDAVRQALDMAGFFRKSESERNGIEITITPVLEEGCMVRGSKTELFEATANLIKNAVEAMPNGGAIRVETCKSDGRVVLRVTDEGVGIGEENLPKIFEPFFTTKGIEASGMGLAGSYGIVNRHQGTISCESEPGKGTTFTVGLPPAGTASVRAPAHGVQEVTSASLRILVIDDVEPILLMLGEALTEMGQKVFACRSGQEGLDLLGEQSVDAVVSDLGMPGLNGWEVGKKVKEMFREKGERKPPFIMLSGWTGLLEETEKIAESGVDAVVGKPVDAFKLLHVIQDLVENAPRSEGDESGGRSRLR
jgi:PAS domain S-box-containing protein